MFDLPDSTLSMDGSKVSQIKKAENLACKRYDAGRSSGSDVQYCPIGKAFGK
jgi:hypothetical protein